MARHAPEPRARAARPPHFATWRAVGCCRGTHDPQHALQGPALSFLPWRFWTSAHPAPTLEIVSLAIEPVEVIMVATIAIVGIIMWTSTTVKRRGDGTAKSPSARTGP